MNYDTLFIFVTFLIGSISAALKPRIIDGEDADIINFPYMASIRIRGNHLCGACIISSRHVLTAAHCITHNNHRVTWPSPEVTVSTGTSNSMQPGNVHQIAKVTVHPGWKGEPNTSGNNDIAVVTLADEITFDRTQQKIDLASREVINHLPGVLTGWGRIAVNNRGPNAQLQKLSMRTLTSLECQRYHDLELFKEQMCSYCGQGRGSCFGDSGGPLVVNNEIVGVLSWVPQGLYAAGTAEILSNVYSHRNFINSAMER